MGLLFEDIFENRKNIVLLCSIEHTSDTCVFLNYGSRAEEIFGIKFRERTDERILESLSYSRVLFPRAVDLD